LKWDLDQLFFNVSEWIENYAKRRYGFQSQCTNQAWKFLFNGAYQYGISISIVEEVPKWGMHSNIQPIAGDMVKALRNFIASSLDVANPPGPWYYDLVDITRQFLSNTIYDQYKFMEVAKNLNNSKSLRIWISEMNKAIDKLDSILGTNENYLLGHWIQEAMKWKNTMPESVLQYNLRNQLTLWGPEGQINDYAAKHWNGLVGNYYSKRWDLFFEAVLTNDWTKYNSKLWQFQIDWNLKNDSYPSTPVGDPIELAQSIMEEFGEDNDLYTYQFLENADFESGDLIHAWSNDIEQLKLFCSLDSFCAGFNTKGILKRGLKNYRHVKGVNFYTKMGIPKK